MRVGDSLHAVCFCLCGRERNKIEKMASKLQKQGTTEHFIEILREEKSLRNVKSTIYKERKEKVKSILNFREIIRDYDISCITSLCKNFSNISQIKE